jgi:gas vesicle protein
MKKSEKVISAGIGIAALAAIGAYFLAGKRGAKNRERIYGWTLKMKGEVLEKVEDLKNMKKEDYYKIVDEVAARYEKVERVSASELRRLADELKDAWAHISKQLK